MVRSVVILALAAVAQAAPPAPKADTKTAEIRTAKLNEAQRLLRNGRYAEAEEALAAIEAQEKKEPAGLAPTLAVALAVSKAECQSSQGEYAKAIAGLEGAAAGNPKSADLFAQLADLHLTRGEWEAAEAAMRQAQKLDPEHLHALGARAVAGAAR